VVLMVLSQLFGKELSISDAVPFITIIISAFNEEKVIAKKIESTLSLEYPENKIEILIVSDHSTDMTDEIVRGYSEKNIILLTAPQRRGKTAGLNNAVLKSKGEIIVFSDADSMYNKDVLLRMTSLLNDPVVGLVTGSTEYISEGEGEIVKTSGIYTKLERFIKQRESHIGSCVGADGAIFAVKKALYKPLNDDDINDLVIPLNVVKLGYRVIFGDKIFCSEAASLDITNEFRRQIRITNRTLWALFRNISLMNIVKYPLFAFELISHKLIRFSIPFLLLALIALNCYLFNYGLEYQVIFVGQVLFYLMAIIGFIMEKRGVKNNTLNFVYHFIIIQTSVFLGWCSFFAGKKQVTWNPRN